MRALLASPGWHILSIAAQGQVQGRTNEVMYTPLVSPDLVLKQEYTKGEANGINTFLRLPQALLDSFSLNLEMREDAPSADSGSDLPDLPPDPSQPG